MRSKPLVFSLSDAELDVCPEAAIFYRRIIMLRRTLARLPEVAEKIRRIYWHYASIQYMGSNHLQLDPGSLHPAPPF
eukprot:1542392-Karenia_brevis.AAC.1